MALRHTNRKRKWGRLEITLRKYELTAKNTIHPPKDNDRQRLVTWTSGDGKNSETNRLHHDQQEH